MQRHRLSLIGYSGHGRRVYSSGTEGGESIDANITSLTGKPHATHEANVAVALAFSADTGPSTR